MDTFFATRSYNDTRDWRSMPELAKASKPKGKTLAPVDRDRFKGRVLRNDLAREMVSFFGDVRASVIPSVVSACKQVSSVMKSDKEMLATVDSIMGLVDFSVFSTLPKRIRNTLYKTHSSAGIEALKITNAGAGVAVHPRKDAFAQVHEDALDYSKFHSAELVGMTYDGAGDLVSNTRVEVETGKAYAITEETRDGIRSHVEDVVSGRLPITELADTLRGSYGLSDTRASMIARTEYNKANGEGALAGYRINGIKYKRWMSSHDSQVSDECQANEEQGPIPVDEAFQSGDMTDPAHPNCRCNIAAHIVLGGDDNNSED